MDYCPTENTRLPTCPLAPAIHLIAQLIRDPCQHLVEWPKEIQMLHENSDTVQRMHSKNLLSLHVPSPISQVGTSFFGRA